MATRTGSAVIGKGQVKGLVIQVEPATHQTVARFQVERKSAAEKMLPPVPVEMRGFSFDGTLANGDWVELATMWKSGQLVRPKSIQNLTTGVPYKATLGVKASVRPYGTWGGKVALGLKVLFAIAVVLFLLWALIQQF